MTEIRIENLTLHICQYCNMLFKNKAQMYKHKREFHLDKMMKRDKRKEFPCYYCDFIAKSRYQRRNHEKKVHDATFKCSDCDKTFCIKQSLDNHIITYHSSNEEVEKLKKQRAEIWQLYKKQHGERFESKDCPCGGRYSEASKLQHEQSKRHIEYLKN